MSRSYNIKWSKNDYEKLKKSVRNAKDKARRLGRADPGVSLPDIPTFAQLKATIGTRSEFNKVINQLQSFSQRGGEQRMSTNLNRLEQNQQVALQKELNRVAAQFNKKVDELSKKYAGTDVVIPEKITDDTYKDMNGNSYLVKNKDLRNEIQSLSKFLRKGQDELIDIDGNKNNIKITKWQKEYMENATNTINQAREQRRIEYEERAKKHNIDRGRADLEYTSYLPTKAFTENQTMADLRYRLKHLRKERNSHYWSVRDEISRNAYVGKLESEFAIKGAKPIIDAIKNMGIEEWKDIVFDDPDDFKTLYQPDEIQQYEALIKLTNMFIKDEKKKERMIKKFDAEINRILSSKN